MQAFPGKPVPQVHGQTSSHIIDIVQVIRRFVHSRGPDAGS